MAVFVLFMNIQNNTLHTFLGRFDTAQHKHSSCTALIDTDSKMSPVVLISVNVFANVFKGLLKLMKATCK